MPVILSDYESDEMIITGLLGQVKQTKPENKIKK